MFSLFKEFWRRNRDQPLEGPAASLNEEETAMLLDMIDHGQLQITRLTSDMLGLQLHGLAVVDANSATITPTQLAYDIYHSWLEGRPSSHGLTFLPEHQL